MTESVHTLQIEVWHIDRFVFYARNPRKNDAAIDRMCSSIREFGFKIPVLARSDGTVVDGHLRIKAARKLGSWPGGDITGIPVILCDEWTDAQVKAFRLMVNRSVTWAQWDDELLSLELQELNEADFDLSLTGFDPKEIDDLLLAPDDDDKANAAPPLPDSPVSRLGDLWICGRHRVLCGDATSPDAVAMLLGDRKPFLMVTDPPYGIELDSEWRDRAGLNGCGPAEASYMKQRTEGHTETTISGDTRADWSEAFELVPSLDIVYVWLNVEATVGKPQVAYKETLTQMAEGESKYARQTTGRGHYAHAKIRLLPGKAGTGYVFESQVAARNQFRISGSWVRSIRATFFIGSRRLRMARKHQ